MRNPAILPARMRKAGAMKSRRTKADDIIDGMECEHRLAVIRQCEFCRLRGAQCRQLSCPDCGLFWDPSESA